MLQPSRYLEKLQQAAKNYREQLDQLDAIDFVAAPRIPNSTVPHPFSAPFTIINRPDHDEENRLG